jgi:uncharacterized repeat protein (TIGR01451 family)
VRLLPLLAGVILASGALTIIAPAASANVAHQDISSAGPLTHVYLGNELSCQVAHSGDSAFELYPPTGAPADCGTFFVLNQGSGSSLYAPNFTAHSATATGNLGSYSAFTPVSQTGVTGSGTSGDPYQVVTVVNAGNSGLQLTQTDTYVVGSESYQTDVTISNHTESAQSGILYRAGDCYLQGSDTGTGIADPGASSVGCQASSGRIEEWVPITADNNYYESFYGNVWARIGSHAPFPDTCDCDLVQDNGAGISWNTSIPAGQSATYSQITAFSPTGNEPLSMTKTADASSAPAGGGDGYTISVSNPNDRGANLTAITDGLPAGFSYVNGSTTGVTTSDPSIDGQTLTWNGSFAVPSGGSSSLHFNVVVSSTPGDYFNNASGTASHFSVAPTGPTAEITVTGEGGADLGISMSADPASVSPGATVRFRSVITDHGPQDATGVTLDGSVSSNGSIQSITPSQGSCSQEGGTIACSLGGLANGESATVDVLVKTPSEPASVSSQASVSADQGDPNSENNQASASTEPCSDCTGGWVDGGGLVSGPPIGGDVTQSASIDAPPQVTGEITSQNLVESPCQEPPDFETYGEVFLVTTPTAHGGRQVFTNRFKMVTSEDSSVGVPPHERLKRITLLRSCVEIPRCLTRHHNRASIPAGSEGCVYKVHRDMETKVVTITELDTGNDPPIRGGG